MFLEIHDLKKSYGEDSNRVDVLKGINFSVDNLCSSWAFRFGQVHPSEYHRRH